MHWTTKVTFPSSQFLPRFEENLQITTAKRLPTVALERAVPRSLHGSLAAKPNSHQYCLLTACSHLNSSFQFVRLDSGDAKQIHFDDNENHTLNGILVRSNGKMYATCTRHREIYTLSLHENVKANTPSYGDEEAGRRFGLPTSPLFVLLWILEQV